MKVMTMSGRTYKSSEVRQSFQDGAGNVASPLTQEEAERRIRQAPIQQLPETVGEIVLQQARAVYSSTFGSTLKNR